MVLEREWPRPMGALCFPGAGPKGGKNFLFLTKEGTNGKSFFFFSEGVAQSFCFYILLSFFQNLT
jgi:hypothetical protein